MSDAVKPEATAEKNKKPEYQCHIYPEQYKINADKVTAPIGSFPWAMIQVYLGNQVSRKDWDSPAQYLRLKSKAVACEEQIYIEEHDKHDHWVSWHPKQEDMVACDWDLKVSTPETIKYNITFDITPMKYVDAWGGDTSNKSLVMVETNIVDDPISALYFNTKYNSINVFLYLNLYPANGMEILKDIRAKHLTVTVDGVQYECGYPVEKTDWPQPLYIPWYKGSEAEKIGNLLQQAEKTYRIQLNWHD
ncbi:Thoeris anti-defense Tad2 family protein [Xenorhabdus bovienii]|uniref:Thoeris anti-defense Tad2 family protein n=1 Tax=Xenorhabdus bovienii TaxID=40576 RepID=UPI003DA4FAEA